MVGDQFGKKTCAGVEPSESRGDGVRRAQTSDAARDLGADLARVGLDIGVLDLRAERDGRRLEGVVLGEGQVDGPHTISVGRAGRALELCFGGQLVVGGRDLAEVQRVLLEGLELLREAS